MKPTIIILLAALAVSGCDNKVVERNNERNKCFNNQIQEYIPPYKIVVIDSCEYLVTQYYNANASLTHKGNCNNPIHK